MIEQTATGRLKSLTMRKNGLHWLYNALIIHIKVASEAEDKGSHFLLSFPSLHIGSMKIKRLFSAGRKESQLSYIDTNVWSYHGPGMSFSIPKLDEAIFPLK